MRAKSYRFCLYFVVLVTTNFCERLQAQLFTDVTDIAGFRTAIQRVVNSAWCDFNKDGHLDLFIRDGEAGKYHLMLNHGDGSFTDIAEQAGLNSGLSIVSGVWGDFNNDTWPDLAVLGRVDGAHLSARTQLFKNLGNNQFTDIAPAANMDLSGDGETAQWLDYDGDGDLDLITPYYVTTNPPVGTHLFRNDGSGNFTDVTVSSGIYTKFNAEGAVVFDYDIDGDLDVYLSGTLFRNNGDGTFADFTQGSGLAGAFDEGCSAGDFDNDGFIDLLICEQDHPVQRYTRLYRNLGNGTFQEVTDQQGIPHTLNWGAGFIDYDNDGWLDIWVGSDYNEQSLFSLYENQNGTGFTDVTPTAGLPRVNYSVPAWGDFDNDGDMDLVIGQLDSAAADAPMILKNQTNNQNFLFVRATDQRGCENQFGAVIRIYDAATHALLQTRGAGLGGGYLSQNQYSTHFGISENGAYDIEVTFPGTGGNFVRIGKDVNSILGHMVPSSLGNDALEKTIEVRRDGHVQIGGLLHIPFQSAVTSLLHDNQTGLTSDLLTLSWWCAQSTPRNYEVQISNESDFQDPEYVLSDIRTDSIQLRLTSPGIYFWRARITDPILVSPWSDLFSLGIDTGSPIFEVNPVHPKNNDTLTLYKAPILRKFVWNKVLNSNEGDSVYYSFRLYGGGLDTIISGIQDTFVQISGTRLREETWYEWKVSITEGHLENSSLHAFNFKTTQRISIYHSNLVPTRYALDRNYPNPFNPSTTFRFRLPDPSDVQLDVYNILGQRVATLIKGEMDAGFREFTWDSGSISSGVYIVLIRAQSLTDPGQKFTSTRKIVLLK